MRKLFIIIIWTSLAAGVIAALVFFGRKHDTETTCENFELSIMESKDPLIGEEAIRKLILAQTDTLTGQSLEEIDMLAIKQVLDDVPYIREADIHSGIKGQLKISILLREPMMRIINENNFSYYIDSLGYLMPLNPGHPARVIILNGAINDNIATLKPHMNLDSMKANSVVEKLHNMGMYIHNSIFLSKLIGQVWIENDKDIQLIPIIGEYTIYFGGFEDMEEKFDKLTTYYHEGAGKTGWIDYKSIDLRYKNQVICSKN